jgi:hypothetical protein
MGSLPNAIKSVTGQDDNAKAVKQRLELLLMAAKAKILSFRDELDEQFMNPAEVDKIQIPGIRAIRYIEQYHVAASENFSQQVGDHLSQAIDAFFSIGGKDVDTKKAVQSGVKALISTALDAFIGSTEAGESEEKIYVVVPENNSFVRADVRIWKYHMESKQLIDDKDTAVAYVLCKSVIDHTKLAIDELIYFVSEALTTRRQQWVPKDVEIKKSDGTPMLDAANKPIMVTKKFVSVDTLTPMKKDPSGKDDVSNWVEWTIDAENTAGGSPPSIVEVEAYIEELIRVWRKLREEKKADMV